jgi:hypothetical protein
MRERYTDFFVCIAAPLRGQAGGVTFVLPWEHVRGKTFSLHAGRRPYAGQYARFRDQWRTIAEAAHVARKGEPLHAAA